MGKELEREILNKAHKAKMVLDKEKIYEETYSFQKDKEKLKDMLQTLEQKAMSAREKT